MKVAVHEAAQGAGAHEGEEKEEWSEESLDREDVHQARIDSAVHHTAQDGWRLNIPSFVVWCDDNEKISSSTWAGLAPADLARGYSRYLARVRGVIRRKVSPSAQATVLG